MDKDKIDVEITAGVGGAKATAVIKDQGSRRAWSGEGDTTSEAATEATRKFLGDRNAREYLSK